MATGRAHQLKTWPEHFEAVISGAKRFELRPNDRAFEVGDVLVLREFVPDPSSGLRDGGRYTGRSVDVRVTYLVERDPWGALNPRWCILGIERTDA